MVKKITLLVISLVLAQTLIGLIFFKAFVAVALPALYPLPGAARPQGLPLSPPKLPLELILKSADSAEVLPQNILQTWVEFQSKPAASPPPNSLAEYFIRQTAPFQPPSSWTNPETSASLKSLALNEPAVGEYIKDLALRINRPSQNAELLIEDGKAVKFVPHQTGRLLDLARTRKLLQLALVSGANQTSSSWKLPIYEQPPQTKLEGLNNLGIREFLARGQSDFSGSSASRIQNIRVGASRYQGLIVPAGAEFSFNKHLGPIDAASGFRPELVIKPEGTVPEFGGGLCQVSSTAFRAAFFGGLPITARRNHSYAVKYYEWISDDRPKAVGLDATIYPGAQDLKFVNDTPGAILIWTEISGTKLYFDFYGTADEREVAVDGPHPYDRKNDGSVKSTVTRKVVAPNGEIAEITFNSRYVSPNLYPKIYEYPSPATQISHGNLSGQATNN